MGGCGHKEENLIRKRAFNLEEEALLASGIQDRGKIDFYAAGLNRISQQFVREMTFSLDPEQKARALFTWLWRSKPHRYKPQGNFRLSKVIEAQSAEEASSVGNCLGLTLLYNCLLRKMGIYAKALYLENAFGNRPHVLTLLKIEKTFIDVENILPDGFDYRGHRAQGARTRWGDRELVADVYHSVGNELFEKGDLAGALRSYDRAILFNSRYEKAHINRAILLDKMGKER